MRYIETTPNTRTTALKRKGLLRASQSVLLSMTRVYRSTLLFGGDGVGCVCIFCTWRGLVRQTTKSPELSRSCASSSRFCLDVAGKRALLYISSSLSCWRRLHRFESVRVYRVRGMRWGVWRQMFSDFIYTLRQSTSQYISRYSRRKSISSLPRCVPRRTKLS